MSVNTEKFVETGEGITIVKGEVMQYYLNLPASMKKKIHDPVLSKLEILNKGLLEGVNTPTDLNKKYDLT
jgi:hypothetical protein